MVDKKHPISPEHYQYKVTWSPDDNAFVARVTEFPSLAAHGDSQESAIAELRSVVQDVIKDLKKNREVVPEPLSRQQFSGKLNLRMPPYLHRKLVIEAAEQGVSLNYLINLRLEEDASVWEHRHTAVRWSEMSSTDQGRFLIERLKMLSGVPTAELRLIYGEQLLKNTAEFLATVRATPSDKEFVYQHFYTDPEKVSELIKKYLNDDVQKEK